MFRDIFKVNKLIAVSLGIVFIFIIGLWVLYAIFGHRLIEGIYEAKLIGLLNNIFNIQHDYSVEAYLQKADSTITFYIGMAIVCYLFFLSFVYKNRLSILLMISIMGAFLTFIYVFNPYNRIYSVHGLMQAAITNQLLIGNIPPLNPFLGGITLNYPWGHHFLVACLVKYINISQFIAFALVNILSICITAFLIYKIANHLIRDQLSNKFSILFALYGVMFVGDPLYDFMDKNFHIVIEDRGMPVFKKFTNINGSPLGIVFFTLFLFSVIKISESKKNHFYLLALFVSILGCGFFYPGMFFNIVASAAAVCLVNTIFNKSAPFVFNLKKSILILGILFISILLLKPYFYSIGAGIKASTLLNMSLAIMLEKLIICLFTSLPVLILILVNISALKKRVNRQTLVNLLAVIVATFILYICLQMPDGAEYKSVMLSGLVLGIIGGIAFNSMWQRSNKFLMFPILCLFLMPSYQHTKYVMFKYADLGRDIGVIESGKDLISADSEEDELYRWIRENTAKGSIFIDAELAVPLFAQRQLFIGINMERELGYTVCFLDRVCNYDPGLLDTRKRIMEKIYAGGGNWLITINRYYRI